MHNNSENQFPVIAITRRHILSLPLLILASCRKSASSLKPANLLVPSDKVIPAPTLFGEDCAYDTSIMDDLSAGFARGQPFQYDKLPYTAVLSFKRPAFDLSIWYWADPKTALDSFIKGRSQMEIGGSLVSIQGFKSKGSIHFFTYAVGGKVHGCSMLAGNVHFALSDLYRELGEKRVLELSMAYADYLTQSAK